MKYKIEKGHDHYNSVPLFRVVGIDNDYVGEWDKNKGVIDDELNALEPPKSNDLFEYTVRLPEPMQLLCDEYCAEDSLEYEAFRVFKEKAEKLGYSFSYGLDGVPFNLHKIEVSL